MKPGITINQRLAKVREALGHTPQAFAGIIGKSRPYLANIESGRREVGLDLVSFLIETLSVAPDYILFGRGPMFHYGTSNPVIGTESANLSANPSANLTSSSKTKRTKNQEGTELAVAGNEKLRILVTTVDSNGDDNISLVHTRVAAGYASGGFHEPEFMRDLPTFSLPDRAFKNGTFRAFQVSGESMQPTLYEGDWVICRYIDQWDRDIRDTFVHVIVTEEMPLVKRLLNRLNDRGQISLQSDNPAFPTQFIDGAEVREVWVAVGRLSRQFANPRYDLVQEMSRTRSDLDEVMAQLQTIQHQIGLKLV